MTKKILVPLDGSKNSYRGLDEAINLARQCKAVIIGIHVKDMPGIYALHPIGFISLASGKEAKKVIEHAKTVCAKRGILFHGKILGGLEASRPAASAKNSCAWGSVKTISFHKPLESASFCMVFNIC